MLGEGMIPPLARAELAKFASLQPTVFWKRVFWANDSVGKKKGATRQRGLKLRLRDLGKIWVLLRFGRMVAHGN